MVNKILTLFNVDRSLLDKVSPSFFAECKNDYIIYCDGVASYKDGILEDLSGNKDVTFQSFLNFLRNNTILDDYTHISLFDLTVGIPDLSLHNIASSMIRENTSYLTLVKHLHTNEFFNGVLLSTNVVQTLNTLTLDEAYIKNLFNINGMFINVEHFRKIEHATNISYAWGYNYLLKYLSEYNSISLIPKVTFHLTKDEEYKEEYTILAKDTYNGLSKKRKKVISDLK